MVYEKESPPPTALHSPKWNTSSRSSSRTRAFLIIGVIIFILTVLGFFSHYNDALKPQSSAPVDSSRVLKGLEPMYDPHQQDKFGSLRKPPTIEENDSFPDITNVLPTENVISRDIPAARKRLKPELVNSTLGFGKIYVLNLEKREDRHDEMAMIAAATGLNLTYVAGINSQTLEKQSLPDVYGTSEVILEPAHLACYRGHANIWRKIVEDGVDTALIIEDDVDWDLNIREIVPRVMEAFGRMINEPNPFSNSKGTFRKFSRSN